MNLWKNLQLVTALGAVVVLAPACTGNGAGSSGSGGCDGGKCDTPVGNDEACLKRESEVLSSSQRGYTPTDIRWACADVEGVNTNSQDDRGQEYCEYWAIFQPPPAKDGGTPPAAVDLGRNLAAGGTTPPAVCLPGTTGDQCRITLTDDQEFALEDTPTKVVGACVFTSWHADVPGPLPNADKDAYGFKFTEDFFRMKVGFNSNRAAADLVEKCFHLQDQSKWEKRAEAYDWSKGSPDDDWQNPFFRGCSGANALFGTGWRRSDPSVCSAVNRLRECGCAVPGVTTPLQLGDAIVPPQPQDGKITKRGFELATWDDRHGLPPGCKYADIGEDSQAVVLCDITATDLIQAANDAKEFCRSTYGNNVVVHVPLPASAITCTPPDTPEAKTCGKMPWDIGDENAQLPASGSTTTGGGSGGAGGTGGTGGGTGG